MRSWKIELLAFGVVALLLSGCGEQSEQAAEQAAPQDQSLPASLAIENVTIIDANQILENATVVISGETIAAVGATAAMTLPDTAERIDGTGKYLIPGLWDAHVHLSYYPDLTVDAWYPLLLANGITSVRDTGGLIEKIMPLRDIARAEGATAPRVYVAGPLVDGAQRVYAGLNGWPNISVGVGSPEEARAEIDRLQAAGVDGMEHLRNLELACAANYGGLLAERRETLAASTDMDGGDLRTQLHSMQREAAIAAQDSDRCQTVIKALGDNRVFQTPTLTVNTIRTERLFSHPR